jgi:phospholipid/cholesterol/gamma-HCH transport system ATP-binding protein
MLEIKNLSKSFGKQKVLDGLNLVCNKHETTVIIGRSGEGKSVLLKHFIGLLRPDAGSVIVEGTDVTKLNDKGLKKIRARFGYLFQDAALFDFFNVYENISFPLREHTNLKETEIRKIVQKKLELVGLPNVENKKTYELSGGMRKRVGLARAIALDPEIILYDEPTTGLDPVMTDAIGELILKTQKELNITTILISHDIESTFKIADKIALLYEGKIILAGDKKVFQTSTNPIVRQFLEGTCHGPMSTTL